ERRITARDRSAARQKPADRAADALERRVVACAGVDAEQPAAFLIEGKPVSAEQLDAGDHRPELPDEEIAALARTGSCTVMLQLAEECVGRLPDRRKRPVL